MRVTSPRSSSTHLAGLPTERDMGSAGRFTEVQGAGAICRVIIRNDDEGVAASRACQFHRPTVDRSGGTREPCVTSVSGPQAASLRRDAVVPRPRTSSSS
jgi:hypothetical protein